MKVSGFEMWKLVSLKQSEQLRPEEEPDKNIRRFLFILFFFYKRDSKKPRP